jgi:hypothetical protein
MPRLDLPELVDAQRSERYRGIIIHADAMAGKTRTALALAQALPDAAYLDCREAWAQDADLARRIDRFGPSQLESWLVNYPAKGQVVIVDHLDLLLNTWTPAQRRAFAQWVDDGLDAFTDSPRVFVFFVQTDEAVVNYPMQRPNRYGHTRIMHLSTFNAL